MAQALYRKYRSKSLDTVVGQEHITSTLAHALKTGKLAHAYLFTGPRGVGKTSIARIMAHEINGLPYTDDSMHLDIIEIDAASNRRIDEIRELRDKVNIAPSSAKYKVYIIDEVHMLTREAFNALLKTLEEPPAHAVFILATTESHKLPETIVSRTQRFMFKPVSHGKVVAHLRSIADSEGLRVTDEALAMIAAHGEGSFRDSISLLDQMRGFDSGEAVGADQVRLLIGQPTDESIAAICEALTAHDSAQLVQTMTAMREQGFAAPQVAKHLGQRLRTDILQGHLRPGVFELLQRLLDVPAAHEPESYLELVLLEAALAGQAPPAAPVAAPPARHVPPAVATPKAPKPPAPKLTAKTTKPAGTTAAIAVGTPQTLAPPAASTATTKEPAPAVQSPPKPAPASSQPLDASNWPQVLDRLKKTHNTLYGIVRLARPVFGGDGLELYFKFAFHQKRLSEAKNRSVILAAIHDETGREAAVKFLVEDKDAPPAEPIMAKAANGPAPTAAGDPLSAISNIFGGAEVLES